MPTHESKPQNSAVPLQFSASSKSLLASLKKHEQVDNGEPSIEEKNCHELKTEKYLSILVPDRLSYDSLAASGTLTWKHFLFSPVKTFYRIRQAREEISLSTPFDRSFLRQGVNLPLVGEVKWADLKKSIKDWVRDPKNLALLLWGTAVGISGAVLFLVMVGFLDHAIRSKSERDAWFEINNQILNALFTMMCLYLHPQRLLHAFLLYRWRSDDIKKLREVYCKGGTYKPHEWGNMVVVVLLLNVNCFAQYALCGLNWGYRRSQRPALGVGLCLAVAIGAPAAAGIYTVLSSLGKDYEEDDSHQAEREQMESAERRQLDKKPSFKIGRGWKLSKKHSFCDKDGKLAEKPEWTGGLFDCYMDRQVTIFASLCGFCVFGWNMERLGFGNRFVHIVTFILLCTAPYWIFNLAATNIENTYVRQGLSYGGIVLCVFGLLYGGFWRIQMRRTFGLPAQKWCFGRPNLTDCTQWLFCSLCSLCQEVRTSEHYRIYDSKFYERPEASPPTKWTSPGLSRLGQQASSQALISSPVTSPPASYDFSVPANHLDQTVEAPEGYPEILVEKVDMNPPIPPVLMKEAAADV